MLPCCAGPARRRLPQIVTLDNRFHRRPDGRQAFGGHPRRARFGPCRPRASGFTLRRRREGQVKLDLLPHRSCEDVVLCHATVRAFDSMLPTMPSADFPAAITGIAAGGKTDRLHRTPAGLPPLPLMTVNFAITCLLARPGRPRYPVLVHRVATLLRASFTPRLATTPLRFANPSPSSSWIKDFHRQAVGHARHTRKWAMLAHGPRLGRKRLEDVR